MKPYLFLLASLALPFTAISALSFVSISAQEPPAKPIPVITPGKVIIPIEKMRRIWGELISIDLATRTGTFRNESTDEVMSFTVMPSCCIMPHLATCKTSRSASARYSDCMLTRKKSGCGLPIFRTR